MGVLASKVELALKAHLRAGLPTVLPSLEEPTRLDTAISGFVVTDTGFHIITTMSNKFDLLVQVGETELEINPPCIVCVCDGAMEESADAFTGNHALQAFVDVRFPGDSWTGMPDVVAALQEVSLAVCGLLYRSDLPYQLSFREADFCCQGVMERSQNRLVENRVRIHRYNLSLYCCLADLEVEGQVPILIP